MGMWIAILTVALLLAAAAAVYLVICFGRFYTVKRVSRGRRLLRILLGCVPVLGFVVYGLFDSVNAVIILIHLAAFFLIMNGIARIVKRIRDGKKSTDTADKNTDATGDIKNADAANNNGSTVVERKAEIVFRPYYAGIVAVLLCAVYLCIGWHLAHHVFRTAYTLETEKPLPGGKLRIAMIADSHIGTTFDGVGFGTYIDKISEEDPDIVVVVGDFVDDSTSREDMIAACAALGRAKNRYGIYFVYGNHDKGYYNSRPFTAEELDAELRKNGVNVLEDEISMFYIDEVIVYVVGRRDRDDASRASRSGKKIEDRKSIPELFADFNEPCQRWYTIVLDHQPHDYDDEVKAGVDLVLSGHTHGGQLFPLAPIGYLSGANEQIYGLKKRGDHMASIVTSGISDWAIDYKTGTYSEYVIIDIVSE